MVDGVDLEAGVAVGIEVAPSIAQTYQLSQAFLVPVRSDGATSLTRG
jgi:hypothetical protein